LKSLSNICLVLLTILVISVLVIIITATDENQSIISIPDSFASVSDRDVTNKSVFLKASNLQSSSSSQQDSTVNNSTLGKINSNSSISYSSISSTPTLPQIIDPNLTVEVVADGLNMPTTMAFLAKDDFLILQKNGSLVRIVDGILSDKTRLDVPVAKGFYQGLLGIAVTNQSTLTNNNGNYVFLYYT
jgi:glucose/arabinose dehydrogenase